MKKLMQSWLDFQMFKGSMEEIMPVKNINSSYKTAPKQYSDHPESDDSGVLFNNLKWLRTDEAAMYLRKSENAVRILVTRGLLPVRKFRRRLYFKRSDLDALLNTSCYYGGF